MRILCLDAETGLGGSSRSLYFSLSNMDRTGLQIEVWCSATNPLRDRYTALGIAVRTIPPLPKTKPAKAPSRNLVVLARAARDVIRRRREIESLAVEINSRFDLVHFNLDTLTPVACYLRSRVRTPLIMHMRTLMPANIFARWHALAISRSVDHLIFITENESDNFRAVGGDSPSSTIYNIAPIPGAMPVRHRAVPHDGRFKVACLSNFVWARGVDRLIDIAEAIADAGRRDILFAVAGTIDIRERLPGLLGEIGIRGGTLKDYADARGVSDMFAFLGHVAEPERVLAACDVLVKPNRENTPWSRDILEAMAFGRPTLTVGSYTRFVETGITGYLQEEFDARAMAAEIIRLADNPLECSRLGRAAQERIASLCDGSARAAELRAVWQQLAQR